MFWSPSFDGMADLTPYLNHVTASYTGIQTVPHVQIKWGRLLRHAQYCTLRPTRLDKIKNLHLEVRS